MVQCECAERRLVPLTTLVESVVYVAILVVLLGSSGAAFLGAKAYAVRAAVDGIAALLAEGRAVARTSGTGATLVISADGTGFAAALYPFRPIAGVDVNRAPLRTARGAVGITPGAIFISSSGTASAASWSPLSGTLESEPPCTEAIALTFTTGFSAEAHTIDCATAQLH